MSDYPPEPRLLDTRKFAVIEVDDEPYTIEEEIWSGAGPTYHVFDEAGECVTANDAFEHPPTRDEIRAVVDCGEPARTVGVHITITSELAVTTGEIARRHPDCGIRIEWREGEPDELWHVGAIDGEPTDTWYVVNDQDGTIVEGT